MSKFKSSNGASRHRRASAALFKLGAAAVAACALTATSSAASAQNAARGYQPSELLVTYKSGAFSDGAHNSNVRAGTQGVEAYPLFSTQKVRLPAGLSVAQAIARYSQDPNVAIAQPNYIYHTLVSPGGGRPPIGGGRPPIGGGGGGGGGGTNPTPTPSSGSSARRNPNDPLFGSQWGPKKVKAPEAWTRTTGSSDIVVGVLDTGVRYDHVDLAANMWQNVRRTFNNRTVGEIPGNGIDDDGNGFIDDFYGIDAVNNDSDPFDDEGHGTHCAGIVGAVGNNRIGIAGINWNVKIMALKWLGADGSGLTSDLIKVFQYMINMKSRGVNVRVASCSFGSYRTAGDAANPLEKAIFDSAASAGIVSAVAAGNGGADGVGDDNAAVPVFPANYSSPGIISVAASDQNDRLASFSNFGSPVALAAPGVDILSTFPYVEKKNPPSQIPSNQAYKRLSGTSMAAPHVAGAAALLFAYSPALTVAQVKNAILTNVDVVNALTGRVSTNGRLNIFKAMQYVAPGQPGDPANGGGTPTPTPIGGGGGTPTPTPTGTPTGGNVETPLVNGNIVFTQERFTNGGSFFPTINQIGAQGGVQTILESGIRELQNPSISLQTGRVAFVANLANVTGENFDFLEIYGNSATFSFPENEIFVRNSDDTDIRITNDEANRLRPVDDREPSISPDGTRIVFTKRDINGNDDIYITSASLDITRPGAAPQQFKLVGDIGTTASRESHPSWSPDGTRVVFQSTRGTTANPASKDYDIYIVSVPATITDTTVFPSPIRLTTNVGDDVEPSLGVVRDESRSARPNGQLVYASNRDDEDNNEDETYSFFGNGRTFSIDPGEDYDIYLQDVSVENGTTNRSQRIVDSKRQVSLVLGGTGDVPTGYIDNNGTIPTDPTKPDDDNYRVDFAVRGDDRHPVLTADGTQVIFCSDSNFRDPGGFANEIKNNNPDDDFDIVRVDINGRNFVRLTTERPVRNYVAITNGTDFGTLTVNEDYEPSAGAVVDSTTFGTAAAVPITPANSGADVKQRFMRPFNFKTPRR